MTRRALVLSGALVLLAGLALPVAAFERARSKYGRPVHWPVDALQVKVKRLPPSLDAARASVVIGHAVDRWRHIKTCRVPLGAFGDEPDPHDYLQGKVLIDTPETWSRKATETAWTEVVSDHDTGGIERVTILLNKDVAWDLADPVAPDRVDLGSVITHELGHGLGLAHSYNRSALMRAGLQPGERRRELTDDDIAGVCAVFGE